MAELSDAQIAEEEKFLKGLPRFNIGAFLMPGIWGPAHGFWVCILFYPLYVFIDNLFFGAFVDPQPWKVAVAVLAGIIFLGVSIAFSLVSQPIYFSRSVARCHSCFGMPDGQQKATVSSSVSSIILAITGFMSSPLSTMSRCE